jgi:hypothetical protein
LVLLLRLLLLLLLNLVDRATSALANGDGIEEGKSNGSRAWLKQLQ